jgi:hypothetical protein
LVRSWWQLLPVVTATVLSKAYEVPPGILNSERGKTPPQPRDGVGQAAHL